MHKVRMPDHYHHDLQFQRGRMIFEQGGRLRTSRIIVLYKGQTVITRVSKLATLRDCT